MSEENRRLTLVLVCIGILIYLLYSINFVQARDLLERSVLGTHPLGGLGLKDPAIFRFILA